MEARVENVISTRKITELSKYTFNIPYYQRGYKWGKEEITDLLDDLREFDKRKNKEDDETYCLQPIVVKWDDNLKHWDVIDGQQRLTTLYILAVLTNEDHPKTEPLYEIKYDGRISALDALKKDENPDIPDVYYIKQAREIIRKYQEDNKIVEIYDIYAVARDKAEFIWYEIKDDRPPIDLFKKLNRGQVPLSNAELIKGVFLKEIASDENKCNQLSIEWDTMEQELNNNSFWAFLSNDDIEKKPCIEIVLDSIANDIYKKNDWSYNERDKHFTFRIFYNSIKNGEDVKDLWLRAKRKFSQFKEWYSDDIMFHLVGYLIATSTDKTVDWISEKLGDQKRSQIKLALYKMVFESIVKKEETVEDRIDKCIYGLTQKKEIRKILLFSNIMTILEPAISDNEEKTEEKGKTDIRFPFDKYKYQNRWDIEHIRAKQESEDSGEDPNNTIANLALLDNKTNSEYKDSPFLIKRNIIRDKERSGKFIPICTQNVFNKVYSKVDKSGELSFKKWDTDGEESDGGLYKKEIIRLLNKLKQIMEEEGEKNG